MYVRQPDRNRQELKIPENYSGHAFRDPLRYSDMPPPARIDTHTDESYDKRPELETPSSDLPILQNDKEDVKSTEKIPETTLEKEEKPKSIFSSLLPSNIASSNHFPFGHGIGSEEILILAMMLLIFLSEKESDSQDHELLLLLGLLLFAG